LPQYTPQSIVIVVIVIAAAASASDFGLLAGWMVFQTRNDQHGHGNGWYLK
jgi:hypothetical protein